MCDREDPHEFDLPPDGGGGHGHYTAWPDRDRAPASFQNRRPIPLPRGTPSPEVFRYTMCSASHDCLTDCIREGWPGFACCVCPQAEGIGLAIPANLEQLIARADVRMSKVGSIVAACEDCGASFSYQPKPGRRKGRPRRYCPECRPRDE